MGTRVLCRVHKAGGARPGFSHSALMTAMECIKVAGRMAWVYGGAEVARLLKIVNTRVRWYIHARPPGDLLEFWYPRAMRKFRVASAIMLLISVVTLIIWNP